MVWSGGRRHLPGGGIPGGGRVRAAGCGANPAGAGTSPEAYRAAAAGCGANPAAPAPLRWLERSAAARTRSADGRSRRLRRMEPAVPVGRRQKPALPNLPLSADVLGGFSGDKGGIYRVSRGGCRRRKMHSLLLSARLLKLACRKKVPSK